MLFSFLIILREGSEIALVLAIVLGYLRRTGNREHFRAVWTGAVAAGVLSLGAAAALELTATELSGAAQESFEGFTMLFAVGVLTWMVFWMRRQAASIGHALRHQVDIAIERGSLLALVSIAFVAVLREGLETVLLLFAGAGLLSNGVAELQESGIIGNLGARPWDTDAFISLTTTLGKFLHTLIGYDSAPTWGQIILYWSYLIAGLGAFVVGVGVPRSTRVREPQGQPAVVENAGRGAS